MSSRAVKFRTAIPTPRAPRQKDREFEASLYYLVRPYVKNLRQGMVYSKIQWDQSIKGEQNTGVKYAEDKEKGSHVYSSSKDCSSSVSVAMIKYSDKINWGEKGSLGCGPPGHTPSLRQIRAGIESRSHRGALLAGLLSSLLPIHAQLAFLKGPAHLPRDGATHSGPINHQLRQFLTASCRPI